MDRKRPNRPPPTRIKVYVRFKPLLDNEQTLIEHISPQDLRICQLNQTFTFDEIFPPPTPQIDVFNVSVRPIVDSVLLGYNGCVLAYGQTGSGKSHTMMGHPTDLGMIPRICDLLFNNTMQFNIKISFLEIYNEKVRDLLSTTQDLKVHESKLGGFQVRNLTKIDVFNTEQMLKILNKGNKNRITSSTLMNPTSSRSHSIFEIEVKNAKINSTLVLVDLAGSEKVGKTGARGTLLEEAGNINKSLTSLGMVVNALCDEIEHVPFRDSNLTKILQNSLSGNSKTSLILNCSSSRDQLSETVSTLRFGLRAKNVKTKPEITFVKPETTLELKKQFDLLQQQTSDMEDFLSTKRLNQLLLMENAFWHEKITFTERRLEQTKAYLERLRLEIARVEEGIGADQDYLLKTLNV